MQVKCKTIFWPAVYKNVFEFFTFMDILFVFVCQIFSTVCTINGERGRRRGSGGSRSKYQTRNYIKKHGIIYYKTTDGL